MSMFAVNLLHDFDAKNGPVKWVIFWKANRCRRQTELSHTREEIRQSENSPFMPVRPQENLNYRILFI